jgi:tRNA pseudouridine55 synthase
MRTCRTESDVATPDNAGPQGVLVIDKPAGMTSHDVVAITRRLAQTRRVGHAGTLDPMATGVLVLGLGRATRLLGHLAQGTKTYEATIRLGIGTVTDDAEGTVTERPGVGPLDRATVEAAVAAFRGKISQVPSAVSAIKVDGRRAYELVRAGEDIELKARVVTVSIFDVHDVRVGEVEGTPVLDIDVTVECSAGTYIRALARDLGSALGAAGHLTALRRTAVGPWTLAEATPLDDCAPGKLPLLSLDDAAARAFPVVTVSGEDAERVRHGARLPWGAAPEGPLAVYDDSGSLLALAEARDARLMLLAVLV